MIAEYLAAQLYNRGTRALDGDAPHEAQRALLGSLACAPYTAPSWLNLGNALMNDGDVHAALGCFRRAMTLDPANAQGHVNAAIALLTLGQYEEGWRLYENRFALPEFTLRNGLKGGDETKMWRGEPLDGKTLLVFNEQGVGDTLMMLRYLGSPLYRARELIFRVPASLLRLVRASYHPFRVTVITDSERTPEHDYLVPFMSLPHLLKPRWGHTPGDPYLRLYDGDAYESNGRWPHIGLCWRGNPLHRGDSRRSIPWQAFAPIYDTKGVLFMPLAFGEKDPDAPKPAMVIDYYDTAKILKSLDVLITVDTSVAHLAGALGVPTWLLLPYVPDFRWGLSGETTHWYNSVKVYRQTTRGDWSSVIERVRSDLAQHIQQRSAA